MIIVNIKCDSADKNENKFKKVNAKKEIIKSGKI